MEILLWLVPPVVVTIVAMVWVSWLGREGRGEVDRDVAVRRLAEALQREDKVDRSRPLLAAHPGARPQHRDRRPPLAGAAPARHGSACPPFRLSRGTRSCREVRG